MTLKEDIKEISYAFKLSIPVMLGYIFLGMAFGLVLHHAGYGPIWAFITSGFIYAGSMQFVLVTLLTGSVSVLYAALMTLFVNGRHIFYGLSFIEKFRSMGKAYPYMIFSLTDETYSILCDLKVPTGMDENKVSIFVSLFDHCYWILGSVLGSFTGKLLVFDTTGIDFSMTALFVVIVINQWMEHKDHRPAIIGLCAGVISLAIFGVDKFLLPALCASVAILLGVRKTWNIQS